ncbi:MAG TPA: glycosyltransferase family 39 protein [Acidimicrobiales bacterium]|nr:glycosyltransferase family 39 protein [Acidimicrobiales bacterium]
MPDALRGWGRRALPPLPPLSRPIRWCLVALVVLGGVLRIGWAVQAQSPTELRDPIFYMVLADHVAAGDGYTYGDRPEQGVTAYYPPGYPALLGAAVWAVQVLPGEVSTFDVALGLGVVLSVATIGLVFALGRRLAGPRVGLVAAGIWALWPNLVFHSGVVLTETLFLFLLVAVLLVALGDPAAARAPGKARVLAVGVLFGLAVLVRPVSLVAAPAFLVLWWGAGVRAALWRLALLGGATVAVLVPWSIRSTLAMDEPVALSLNFGDNLCMGHNPGATGGFVDLGAHCFTGDGTDLRRPEYETVRQSENIDRALRYIRDEPATTLRRTPTKLRITLGSDHDGLEASEDFGAQPTVSDGTRDLLELAADGFYVLVVAAGVAGAVVLLRRPDPARRGVFLVTVAALQLVSPLVTFGDARFKMPIYPTLALCAAVAITAGWDRWRGTSGRAATGAASGDPARTPEPSAA